MIYWLHHQWKSLVATIHLRVRMSARSRLGCFRAKLVCWAGRGEEGVPKPLKPSPNYAPKYYATRSSKNLTNLLSWLKIFLLVVLPYAVVLFDFDYFGECIFYYYYSRQITRFWSKFLPPTRSRRLIFRNISVAWQIITTRCLFEEC